MEGEEDKTETIFSKWLDKLQQESWQLELLISGFAIFGLFQLSDFLQHQYVIANANVYPSADNLMFLVPMLFGVSIAVVRIFTINLLVHVFVRGLWIGAIGLRYISGEIDYDRLNYNDRFSDFYKRSVVSFDNYIVKLEKIASVIFSFTFLLAFLFLSYFMIIMEVNVFLTILQSLTGWSVEVLHNIGNVLLPFLLLVAFDFITLGVLKRIKQRHFSKFYFVVYRIVGALTLSFIWRPLLLNFLDNNMARKILWSIVPYMVLIIAIFPRISNSSFKYFPMLISIKGESSVYFSNRYYDSLKSDDYNIKILSIPNQELKGNIFKVFIKYDDKMEEVIGLLDSTLFKASEIGITNPFKKKAVSFYSKKEKKEIVATQMDSILHVFPKRNKKDIKDSLSIVVNDNSIKLYQKKLKKTLGVIKDAATFAIDGEMVDGDLVSYHFYIHPNAKEKGILCYFSVDLNVGTHDLTYFKVQKSKFKNRDLDTMQYTIPFVYIGN